MNKLIVLVGLALFVVAASAQQENSTQLVCPTTRPCCSCECTPKGCPEPQRPKFCDRVRCVACPHKCEHDVEPQNMIQMEAVVTPQVVCPTTRPCCSCACTPKGCPEPQRPKFCDRVKCLFVCPHKCEHDVEPQNMIQTEAVVTPQVVCPTTRPCCSCACTPKGCPPPQKPKHCEHQRCLIQCPHVCEEYLEKNTTQEVAPLLNLAQQQVCPTTRPCCSCACTPKGCPEPQRPKKCERIMCLYKCPHQCDNLE